MSQRDRRVCDADFILGHLEKKCRCLWEMLDLAHPQTEFSTSEWVDGNGRWKPANRSDMKPGEYVLVQGFSKDGKPTDYEGFVPTEEDSSHAESHKLVIDFYLGRRQTRVLE
jgi:hypothetical protein